jgi:hypothetical protein
VSSCILLIFYLLAVNVNITQGKKRPEREILLSLSSLKSIMRGTLSSLRLNLHEIVIRCDLVNIKLISCKKSYFIKHQLLQIIF